MAVQFTDSQVCPHGLDRMWCSICLSGGPRIVWVTRGGDAYHFSPSCEGLASGQEWALEEGFTNHPLEGLLLSVAETEGRRPCKVCVRPRDLS